ncbi:MAG: hypothetical protein RIS64_4071, partial [Bacteroidota bacterium]
MMFPSAYNDIIAFLFIRCGMWVLMVWKPSLRFFYIFIGIHVKFNVYSFYKKCT